MDLQATQRLLERALSDHQAGRREEAERIYRDVLRDQPDNADALHLLGVLETQRGRPDLAVPLLQRMVAVLPNFPQGRFHFAQALAATGRHQEALPQFAAAIQLAPKDPFAR